jgi:hypothetical protein
VFVSFDILMVYNCSNTCLYACEAPQFWISCIVSRFFFSRIVFDEFIVNGGEYGHKVD